MNNLPPFADGIFKDADGGPELLGSRCPRCERHFFPKIAHCSDDAEPTVEVGLGNTAELYSYTVVRTKPPFGLPTPYAVGYVDLPASGLRVFMLLDPDHAEAFRIGMPLRLAQGEVGVNLDGAPCRRPYFTPQLAGD